MMIEIELKKESLSFIEGSSAKTYKCEIEPDPDSAYFNVKFAYGRIGSALNTGLKNSKPVSYTEAVKIFDKLVAEKTAKGYRHDGKDVSIQTVGQKVDTGMRPMLMNEVRDEEELERLLDDPDWDMQEKSDGRRLCVKLDGENSVACNRKGQQVPADLYIHQMKSKGLPDYIYDGEDMGSHVVIFDVVSAGKSLPWNLRCTYFPAENFGSIRFAPLYIGPDKRRAFNEIKSRNGEGVVFRKQSGIYQAGRPNSGGDILKWKFKASATCIVLDVNNKRSVQVGVKGKVGYVKVGNVTVPSNQEIPQIGELIECQYLYAYEGGSLYQPVLLGKRDDTDVNTLESLKLKPKDEEGEL
jgi:bifunctional non-homologous end joining protein LigD